MNDSILEEIVNEFEYILNIQSTPFQYRDNELVKYKTPFDDIIPNEVEQLQIFRDILVHHYGLKAVKKAVKKLQKKDLNKLKESIHNIPESTIFFEEAGDENNLFTTNTALQNNKKGPERLLSKATTLFPYLKKQ
jgi:hypothetical protein